jgi:hypothetical protein
MCISSGAVSKRKLRRFLLATALASSLQINMVLAAFDFEIVQCIKHLINAFEAVISDIEARTVARNLSEM